MIQFYMQTFFETIEIFDMQESKICHFSGVFFLCVFWLQRFIFWYRLVCLQIKRQIFYENRFLRSKIWKKRALEIPINKTVLKPPSFRTIFIWNETAIKIRIERERKYDLFVNKNRSRGRYCCFSEMIYARFPSGTTTRVYWIFSKIYLD